MLFWRNIDSKNIILNKYRNFEWFRYPTPILNARIWQWRYSECIRNVLKRLSLKVTCMNVLPWTIIINWVRCVVIYMYINIMWNLALSKYSIQFNSKDLYCLPTYKLYDTQRKYTNNILSTYSYTLQWLAHIMGANGAENPIGFMFFHWHKMANKVSFFSFMTASPALNQCWYMIIMIYHRGRQFMWKCPCCWLCQQGRQPCFAGHGEKPFR